MSSDEKNFSVLSKNLELLKSRTDITAKQRELCLSLIISEIIKKATKTSDASSLYQKFTLFAHDADGAEKIQFCQKLLSSDISSFHSEPTLPYFEAAPGSHGKIAYVRNNYNDRAFEVFSDSVPNAKPIIMSSFSDACEEVLDSRCEFCIIPLDNTSDGRLFSFYSMLDRYELKITKTCEIETEDRSKSIRYALAGRGISQHELLMCKKKKLSVFTEFSIVSDNALFIGDLITAAKKCGATPIKIDSLPVGYDDNARRFFFIFKLPSELIHVFALYLTLEFSSFSFIGLYTS